jgi:hypothetical protein
MKNADRRLSFVAAVVMLAFIAGCTNKPDASTTSDDDRPVSNSVSKPVDAATTGSVTGVVKFEGVPRKMKVINMAAVPNCAKMHSSPARTEDVLLGDNGTLQNVRCDISELHHSGRNDFRQSGPVHGGGQQLRRHSHQQRCHPYGESSSGGAIDHHAAGQPDRDSRTNRDVLGHRDRHRAARLPVAEERCSD